jgi:IS5 family transposase
MIRLRHQQPNLWETFFAEEVAELWEPWMRAVDELLEDDQVLDAVYDAQGQRHPRSRSRGRHQTPAEVVLRMLVLKHVRNWSYETFEREVRANVVYRSFCRIGMEKVPDAKRWCGWDRPLARKRSASCTTVWWRWHRNAK